MSSTGELGISDETVLIYTWAVYTVLCQIINIFGIVTNIINIICFVKQGFKDSVNISLVGLAISDLGSLTTMFGTCIFITPALIAADLSFEPVGVMYLTTAMAHFSFTRVSGCMTAMITLERCLCITAPLQIKNIITPTRTTVITVCVFLFFFFSAAPVYVVNKLENTFSPLRNKTLLGLVSTGDREHVEMISFTINNFAIPFGAFIMIVVCAVLLSFKLRKSARWRQETITSTQVDRASVRNQKTAKMVVMISTLFIVCFIPVTIMMLAVSCVPEMSINRKYWGISVIISGLLYIMESINSSMNICIYYSMSSKYRDNFLKLFNNSKRLKKA